MGSPYLKSGEAIVMTTHSVSVDAAGYDIMLTTDRIFLYDARSSRFEPKIIPLSSLLSVRGGTTPAREPAIMLLFRQQGDEEPQQPVSLVFLQERSENRMPERDEWIQNLIRLSIPKEEPAAPPEIPVVPDISGEVGLRPTARHGIAPERVRPHSSISVRQLIQPPATIIPDGTGGEVAPAPAKTSSEVKAPVSSGTEVPAHETAPARGMPLHPQTPRVIIPQIIEELLPAHKRTTPWEIAMPASPVSESGDAVSVHLQPQVAKPQTITEEETLEQRVEPKREQAPEPEPMGIIIKEPSTGPKEVPDIIRALRIGAIEPEAPVPPAAEEPEPAPKPELVKEPEPGPEPVSEPVPCPVLQAPAVGSASVPDMHTTEPDLKNLEYIVQEPVSPSVTETLVQPEPAAEEDRPIRHPIPQAYEIRPVSTTLIFAGAAILLIVVVAGTAFLLFPQGTGDAGAMVTPAPGILPVITQTSTTPPVTTAPAATSPEISPVPTPMITPVPPVTALSLPQTGVWIRVNSTGRYAGEIGNLELLRQVTGSGDTLYPIPRSDEIVRATVQRLENTGGLLTVEVYRNGTLIESRSVSAPMGSVSVLIDPVTGRAPGLTASDLLPG